MSTANKVLAGAFFMGTVIAGNFATDVVVDMKVQDQEEACVDVASCKVAMNDAAKNSADSSFYITLGTLFVAAGGAGLIRSRDKDTPKPGGEGPKL